MNFEPPKRRYVLEQRPHDYVYDHVYTASSKRDFYKAAAMGARSGARIKLRPIYKSMFSELLRDRRLEACITIPQPSLLENFLPQYDVGGLPVEPMDTGAPYCQELDPTGADRAKFFTGYTPESYRMARPAIEFDMEEEKRKIRKLTRRALGEFISRGVQSDYRESETQTDPYSPPHVLPYPGANPKVLALIKLTWGKGLPATLEDIVVIERALTRRMLESGSHDVEDDAQFDKRVKLMEELEAQQWADREKELNQIMVQKLDIVSKLLMDLKNKIANEHTMKLEKAFEIEKKRNAKVLATVKHDYLRDMRKLEKKYFGPKKQFKRDIIKEYINFDSPVYAPLVRNGPNLDQLYKVPTYKYQDYNNFELFDQLTSTDSFKKNCLEFDVNAFGERIRNIRLVGKDRRMERKLKDTFNAFRMETMRKNDYDNAAILKQMMMSKINRLTTPILEGSSNLDEQIDQAVIVLQKVIRGRAMQTIMRDEIRHNMDTVLEMKTLHKADPYGLQTTWGEAAAMRNIQKERTNQQEKQNEVTEISDQLEGEALGRMLDFLDKEMVRLLDERKIHALILLAERERRMREATEAGRRQKEEDNRHLNDEVFRHIVGIHQSTVDIYLEDMYLETINRASNDNARLYVQDLARTLNSAAYLMQKQPSTEMDDEEMAAELVHSFVMPEMNRVYQRRRLEALNSRYTRASQQVTDATFSAQGVVREIVDSLAPTIGEHLERGVAAVDGTQIAIDQLIHEAVSMAIQQNCRTISPEIPEEEQSETPDSIDSEKQTELKSVSQPAVGDKFFADQDDFEEGLEEVPEELEEEEEDEFADDEVEEDEEFEEDGDNEESEEEEFSCIPWEPIPVDPNLAEQLGEKSLQIKYRGEVGIDVLGVFEAAEHATADIFEDTKTCLLPPPDTDNESSLDEELDDDDDDSQ